MKNLYWLLLSCLLSCSQQPIKYYHFDSDSRYKNTIIKESAINLAHIETARYLKGQQIAYQLNINEIQYLQNHFWITPLPNEIESYLSKKINRSQSKFHLLKNTSFQAGKPLLEIRIDEFKGVTPNKVRIAGEWKITHQHQIQLINSFDYLLTQQSEGVPSMITTLQKGLDKIANDISMKFN